MHRTDKVTNKQRGWMMVSSNPTSVSWLFTFAKKYNETNSLTEIPKLFYGILPKSLDELVVCDDCAQNGENMMRCQQNARDAIKCVVKQIPVNVCRMIALQADVFHIAIVKNAIFDGLRSTNIFHIIFNCLHTNGVFAHVFLDFFVCLSVSTTVANGHMLSNPAHFSLFVRVCVLCWTSVV